MARNEPSTGPGTWALWLRNALDQAKMSSADLARTGIITEPPISKWLAGQYGPKDAETVIAVAHALGHPNSIAALEASGRAELADDIRRQIRQAYEDEVIVRIRTKPGISARARAAIEKNYNRRKADAVQLVEMELAEAEAHGRAASDGRGDELDGEYQDAVGG